MQGPAPMVEQFIKPSETKETDGGNQQRDAAGARLTQTRQPWRWASRSRYLFWSLLRSCSLDGSTRLEIGRRLSVDMPHRFGTVGQRRDSKRSRALRTGLERPLRTYE